MTVRVDDPDQLDLFGPAHQPGQPLQRPDWLTKDSAWVVLEILAEGPACAEVFWDRLRMNRAAARILDLTDRYGYTIETRRCQRHNHRGNNVEYILVDVPKAAR